MNALERRIREYRQDRLLRRLGLSKEEFMTLRNAHKQQSAYFLDRLERRKKKGDVILFVK